VLEANTLAYFERIKENLYNIIRRSQELKRLKNLQQFFSWDFKAKKLALLGCTL
jgi:hypothetical protein